MKKAAVILLLVLLTAAFALPGSADMNKYSTVFMDTFDTGDFPHRLCGKSGDI